MLFLNGAKCKKVPNKVQIQRRVFWRASGHSVYWTQRPCPCVCLCVSGGGVGGPELGLAFVFGSSGKQRLAQPLKPPPGNTKWQRGSWCHITSGQPSLSPSTCHFIGIPPLCPSRARTRTRHTHTCVKRVLNFSYLHSDTHRRVRLGVDPFFCFSRGDTCVRCYSSTNTHTHTGFSSDCNITL